MVLFVVPLTFLVALEMTVFKLVVKLMELLTFSLSMVDLAKIFCLVRLVLIASSLEMEVLL